MTFDPILKMNLSRYIATRGILFFCLLVPAGCGTIVSQIAYFDGSPVGDMLGDPEVVIYGGSRFDFNALDAAFSDSDREVEEPEGLWIFKIALIIDLVPSFLADTLILPITVCEEVFFPNPTYEEKQ